MAKENEAKKDEKKKKRKEIRNNDQRRIRYKKTESGIRERRGSVLKKVANENEAKKKVKERKKEIRNKDQRRIRYQETESGIGKRGERFSVFKKLQREVKRGEKM